MATSGDSSTPPEALRNLPARQYTARIIKQKVWRQCNEKNQHFMGVVVGREGTGKSHTALKIASGVDPTFTADRVFFDPSRLLETLQDDAYGAGTAVVIDEAGVGLGNRTWYEKDQILLNQALQTARDDNMAVLFTLPRLSELDSQTIGRLHSYIEMTQVNPNEGYALARWMNINPSRDESGEIYKKYPILRDHGKKVKVERVRFTPPDSGLVENYEARKAEFKEKLYQRALDAHEEAESDREEGMSPKDVAQEIAEEGVSPYVSTNGSTNKPYINKDLIRVGYDLSHSDARAAKSLLEQTFSADDLEAEK